MIRRDFLKASIIIPAMPIIGCVNSGLDESNQLISATYDRHGKHQLLVQQLNNKVDTAYNLPFRAHGILVDQQQIFAFGRRPETRCFVVDRQNHQTQIMHAANERHFYGHGVIHHDVLFTTENHYNAGHGVVGLRDRKTLKVIGEYPSYGIGPHDCQLLPDGTTLAVANGGMQTHPETGYRTLNKNSISSALVLIDINSGQKIDEYRLEDKLLSIRHLCIGAGGEIGAALQYQGNAYQSTPESLVAWLAPGGSLRLLESEPESIKSMHGYMGDIAYHQPSNVLAVTSPKGNQVTFWSPQQQTNIWNLSVPQACGISTNQHGFVVSTQTGALLHIKASHIPVAAQQLLSSNNEFAWDNHSQLLS